MSDSPSQELLEAVATEFAVDPSFIEKDWHATQIIAGITTRGSAEPAPVFSGGTSLSKGYGLIRRFSEDLDFKLLLPGSGIDRHAPESSTSEARSPPYSGVDSGIRRTRQ